MTKFGLKPEWKMEVGATPITFEMQEAFNIMLDMNVTNQCSILTADINNYGGKYKSSINNYDEVKFYSRYSGDSWVQMFGGHIDKISYRKTGEGDIMHIELRSYEQQFFFKLLTEGYTDTCVEDIVIDIIDQVNDNVANDFTHTGVGTHYQQTTCNDATIKLYGDTSGVASTVGQSFKPTKENIITIGMKITRVNNPTDLIGTLFEWDTNYATTTITAESGESISADDATKVFELDHDYVAHTPSFVVKRDGSPWGTEGVDWSINYILGIITFDVAPSTAYTWTVDYSCDNYNKLISRDTIDNALIPLVPAITDTPTTTTETTIFVLDAVGLDTTKTYLLDFKLSSVGDGDNHYRIGVNDSGTLSNGILYEAGASVGGEGSWCQFNLFVIDAQDKPAFEVMRDMSNRLGYDWYSNMSKDIQLKPRNVSATETVITGEDIISADYTRDITPLANKIYVYGAEYPIVSPTELDSLTEPDDQAWVDSNWRVYTPDGASTGEVKMIDGGNTAAYGKKYIEMRCVDKTQNDYLKYPYTDTKVVDNEYHSIYFVMKAGDVSSAEPVTIRLEVKIYTAAGAAVNDTFYRDITIPKATWTEHLFRLPYMGSDAGWSGVATYLGRRWNQIRHLKWYVRYRDSGSTNNDFDTYDIWGDTNYVGQKWKADDTDIKQIIVKGRKLGTPPGALKCQVWLWKTDYATSIGGTGVLKASGTLAASEITTSDTILTVPISMESGQKLVEGTDYLIHIIQDGNVGDTSNDYTLRRGTSTNNNGNYYADGSIQSTQSIYFTVDYVHRHAEYISIDGLAFTGSSITHSTAEDAGSQDNFDIREYVIRKDDIKSTAEAVQKAKQTLRHLGWGKESWTGSPGDSKDVQNNGFVSVPGRNDIIPTESVTVQYSEANLNCDFRIDSVSHNFSKTTGWITTLRLAMILPQISVQEMLQHIITTINEVKVRKPTYEKGLSGAK